MRVIIQKQHGEFHSVNGFKAWQGFVERGYEIMFHSWEEMANHALKVDRDSITVGSVAFVHKALQVLDIMPPSLDYPEPLRDFLGRQVWLTNLSEVRSRIDEPGRAIFVKPLEADKAFSGHVISCFRDLIRTAGWPGEMRLWGCEVVQFISEWRFFVRGGEIVGVGHYKGNPLVFPDVQTVTRAVAAYASEAPVAHATDFGVCESGRTLLVEVNDGFSLGSLGFGPMVYSGLLEDRWKELTRP